MVKVRSVRFSILFIHGVKIILVILYRSQLVDYSTARTMGKQEAVAPPSKFQVLSNTRSCTKQSDIPPSLPAYLLPEAKKVRFHVGRQGPTDTRNDPHETTPFGTHGVYYRTIGTSLVQVPVGYS
jgi:hypothetical protein